MATVDDWPDEECDHDDYDADILTGRAVCQSCGHTWYQTAAQIQAEHERAVAYDAQCAEWEHAGRDLRRIFWVCGVLITIAIAAIIYAI